MTAFLLHWEIKLDFFKFTITHYLIHPCVLQNYSDIGKVSVVYINIYFVYCKYNYFFIFLY